MTALETRSPAAGARLTRSARIALVAAAALGVVLIAGTLLTLVLGPSPPPPPRNPFGVGIREGGGAAGGIVGWILAVQAGFYRQLTGLVRGYASEAGSVWPLVGLGFLYGVFHAAGPGHGKAVISAWIFANERALRRGIGLAFAAALLQALVAVALVSVLSLAIGATARTMTNVTGTVETLSFAAVAAVGGWLLWRKAGDLAGRLWPDLVRHDHAPGEACGPGCSHGHLPGPEAAAAQGLKGAAGVVLAAGLRPCTGAIIVLVFALAQSVFAAGIAATFAMALGTALVTITLAAFSVFAKRGALRLAAASGPRAALAGSALEVLAAAAVLALGSALLLGFWSQAGG